MPFDMSKTEVVEAAERLGIDISDMPWPVQYKTVKAALELAGEEVKPKPKAKAKTKETSEPDWAQKMYDDFCRQAKPIMISQEIKPTKNQMYKYEEEVGEQFKLDPISYSPADIGASDHNFGSFVIQGTTGKKVVSTSTLPKENVEIVWDVNGKNWYAPMVKDFTGKWGYLWNGTGGYKGIKQLLIESGYYDKYAQDFNAARFPQNIWMAGGKFFAVSIPRVNAIFEEINKTEQAKGL